MTQPGHTIPTHGSPHAPPHHGAPHPPPMRPPVGPASIRSGVVAAQTAPPTDKELEPLTLIEDRHPTGPTPMGPPPPKKIQAFGGGDIVHKKHDWKRQTTKTGAGACRVRSFHGKYSEQGLDYLDNAINEWLDANPDIEVKFVTPTVMTFEGKIREPALVLNVWY